MTLLSSIHAVKATEKSTAPCCKQRALDSSFVRGIFGTVATWTLATLVLTLGGLEQNLLFASGCNYHHQMVQPSDLPDGTVRIYEYGQFHYYKPAKAPCSGPSCDGSSPNGFQAPTQALSDDQRQPVPVWRGCETALDCQVGRNSGEPANLYRLLSDELLLRPPRAA